MRSRRREVFPRQAQGLAVGLAAALLSIPGTAAAQADAGMLTPYDPLEGMNRRLYAVHRVLDRVVVRPATMVYVTVLPRPVRTGLHNAVVNLTEPMTFLNDVAQARPRRAGRTVARFALNTTVGVGGLIDVSGAAGVPRHYSDLGQTLGRYGLDPGPYLFIPVLGPSTLRDLTGRVGDAAADPVRWFKFDGDGAFWYARGVLWAMDLRATFDREISDLDQTATDPYVTLRAAYLQNRQSFINDGVVDVEALPSFGPEPSAETEPPPDRSQEVADLAAAAQTFYRSSE